MTYKFVFSFLEEKGLFDFQNLNMPKLELKCIRPATPEEWNKTYPEKWIEDDEIFG